MHRRSFNTHLEKRFDTAGVTFRYPQSPGDQEALKHYTELSEIAALHSRFSSVEVLARSLLFIPEASVVDLSYAYLLKNDRCMYALRETLTIDKRTGSIHLYEIEDEEGYHRERNNPIATFIRWFDANLSVLDTKCKLVAKWTVR